LIEDAAVGAGAGWVPWVILVVEAVTGGAVLRAAGRIFLGWGAGHDPLLSRRDEGERADEPARVPPRTAWVSTSLVVVLVAGGLALGLAPGLADAATAAAHRFTAEPGPGAATPPSVQAFVLAALSTAAAAGVAALTLGLHRRVPLRWLGVLTRGPVAVLRAAHSGHTGDYVTWIAVGTLAVGAALVLTAVG
jgi:multicomponent Na+:H+ antiporter subunit D